MAASDAKAVPVKNVALRITFPIFDADGDLVTGATGLDSEVSKDGGAFVDCTNETTEIATASGMYFLDLTSTEMNADTVAVIVKTSTVGAKTTPIVLYPASQNINDLASQASVNTVDDFLDTEVAAILAAVDTEVAAIKAVTDALPNAGALTTIQGDLDNIQTRLPVALVGGRMDSDVGAIQAGAITAAAIATDAIDGDAIAASAVTEIQSGLATAAGVTAEHSALSLEHGALPTADENAEALLIKPIADVEGGAHPFRSLYGLIAKLTNRTKHNTGTNKLEMYQTDDTTLLATQTLSSSSSVDPVVEVNTD